MTKQVNKKTKIIYQENYNEVEIKQLLKRGFTIEQILYNNSLIGKKVIWKGKEHTIIDKHNIGDYVLIDDDNMSMIGLHWKNVKLIN